MASPPPPPPPRQLFATWAPGSSNGPAFVEPDGRRTLAFASTLYGQRARASSSTSDGAARRRSASTSVSAEEDVSATQARLAACAAALGLSSARFRRVPPDYYEHELEWRREALGAHSTKQLCKSMIMENTRLAELSADDASAAGRLKYIIVVLQYDGPKLHRDKLTEVVRALEGSHAAPKKQYNLRMVSSDVSDALSGFEHNAVTPLGMRTRLPLLVSSRLREVSGGSIWLGGGETDLKLNVDIEQFVATLQAAWAPIPVRFADVVG